MVNGMHFRHPAITAKMAATLDILSGGRLDFGIGQGEWSGTKWVGDPVKVGFILILKPAAVASAP